MVRLFSVFFMVLVLWLAACGVVGPPVAYTSLPQVADEPAKPSEPKKEQSQK